MEDEGGKETVGRQTRNKTRERKAMGVPADESGTRDRRMTRTDPTTVFPGTDWVIGGRDRIEEEDREGG